LPSLGELSDILLPVEDHPLRADSDGADFVYPLEPAPVGLQAENPYSAGDFVQAILPLAQRRATGIEETTLS
jgi:hypothetical protein